MATRRKFLRNSFLSSLGLAFSVENCANSPFNNSGAKPIVISTWPNLKANEAAWTILGPGGRALDAVVKGVQVPEADPNDTSVGYGGLPDRDGRVTLDSCVMDEFGNCGAVMSLEHIMHAVLVARMVMEKTPHVQLVGDGALQFALENGFKKQDLLTPSGRKAWEQWLKTSKYNPMTTIEAMEETRKKEIKQNEEMPWPAADLNHDTIGMVALDVMGNMGGACTTSGMAYKMHGRVGDSPIIGAGLFVDNEVGAASATGVGEEVVKVCGSHTIIESMRHGFSPRDACKEAIRRIVKNNGDKAKNLQVGFLALNNKGEHGGYAVVKGFSYSVTTKEGTKVFEAEHLL